jgi:3-phenylpropionate/cinnamic acid dioxygenase small subunit
MADRLLIQDVVNRAAVLLDEEKLSAWLELFDEGSTYELCAYSSEIHKWMTWWKSDRETLAKQLKDVGQHVRDPATRRRVIGMPLVEIAGSEARALSSFSIYRTLPDGQSSLYMVGRYEDELVKKSGGWLYKVHRVVADTRLLESFTHIPI